MEKPKIIIIGANGMLGQALVKSFKKGSRYLILAWGREDVDIADERLIKEKILRENPFLIINAAAYNAVDKIEEDAEAYALAKKINSDGPKYLALIAKQLGIVLVHYVSDYVFDGEKKEYIESDVPKPISRYGETKLVGEGNVQKILKKYYLIRISKLFGNPGISEGAKKSFFAIMLDLARKNDTLKGVDGEISCFTYVDDLADATRKLVEKRFPFGIYHLVNEGEETWYSALEKFFKLIKIEGIKILPVSSSEFPRPAKRPKQSVLKNTKFPHLRSWQEAVIDWLEKDGLLEK